MKVSISGNSARYSIPKAKKVLCVATSEEANTAFKHLSHVQFNPDGTVSIHHDGEVTYGVRTDLKKLGRLLEPGETLDAIGMDYTNNQVILVSVSENWVEVLPLIIKPTPQDIFRKQKTIQQLARNVPMDITWIKSGPKMRRRLTHTMGIVDPGNVGYNFFDCETD